MNSNVTNRSNVFVRRAGVPLRDDKAFIEQVCGAAALRTLLQRLNIGRYLQSAIGVLSQRQLGELAWETACAECGGYPEGPVRIGKDEKLLFRCPRRVCSTRSFRGRVVALPLTLVRVLGARYSQPLADLCGVALQQAIGKTSTTKFSGPKVAVAVRLTPTQFYLNDDESIERAFSELVEKEK
jgi:hypothetical protein